MKRFYLLAWALILSLPVMAKNKISMVTYFPVPYVAYSQTNATGMDIGLSSTCDMKLGCTQSDVTLKATNAVNVTSGRLNLDGGLGVKGSSVVLGEGNKLGKITFNNARLQTANMNSVAVEEDTVTQTLNLFGQKFPSCKAKDGKGKMSWKKLTLAGSDKSELYLVCGDGVASAEPPPAEKDCSDASYKQAHKAECCASAPKTDTECYKYECSYTWVDGSTSSTVRGNTGFNNARPPKGDCDLQNCLPSYSSQGQYKELPEFYNCISRSNAATLLEKAVPKCTGNKVLGESCGAHEAGYHCYFEYVYSESMSAPCWYYDIRISSGLMCKEACSYVRLF